VRVDRCTLAAIAPYAVWMALMFALPATGAAYALRSAATAAALVWSWRVLGRGESPGGRDACVASVLSVALATGLAVAFVWIAPERFSWYREWMVVGGAGAAQGASPYSPDVCGWSLTLARLAGSAFVIAPAEELFVRSFLYRRLVSADWRAVPPRRFDWTAFLWTTGLFALEHDRIAVAAVAGAAYLFAYVRAGFAAAALAHCITNFALGAYVVATGSWNFW